MAWRRAGQGAPRLVGRPKSDPDSRHVAVNQEGTMSTSLKAMASCIGLPSEFSVLRDFYGLWEGVIPTVAGGSETLSLKQQFALLKGHHIHVDIIHVGDIGSDDHAFIDACVHQCRGVYATVNLGVGRVKHYVITEAEADGMDKIGS